MIVTPKLRHVTRAEVREIDRRTIHECHLPGIVLMENAGRGATEVLLALGVCEPVCILAGKGNNGGDGFVIARYLQLAGIESRIMMTSQRTDVTGDALTHMNVLNPTGARIDFGVSPNAIHEVVTESAWIIDALLGTGATGTVRSPFDQLIDSINKAPARVASIDVPSGMDCDTGEPLGHCVRASDTITFVAPKVGFAKPSATEYTGNIHVVDIGAPLSILADFILP